MANVKGQCGRPPKAKSRSYSRKGNYWHKYKEEELKKAIIAVNERGFSISRAAEIYK
jgi:hypothetical protein